jgi:hypothetical protein
MQRSCTLYCWYFEKRKHSFGFYDKFKGYGFDEAFKQLQAKRQIVSYLFY